MLLLEQAVHVRVDDKTESQAHWQRTWNTIKLCTPILASASVLFAEAVTLQLWLQERLLGGAALLTFLLALSFPFLMVLMGLLILRIVGVAIDLASRLGLPIDTFAKRTIRLDDRGLRLSQVKQPHVRWKEVRRWFLTPVPGHDGTVDLTVEYGSPGKPFRRYWSMILNQGEQKHAFQAEVEHFRQTGRTTAQVIELSRPMPSRPVVLKGLWSMAIAYFLFIHGVPLLLVGVMPANPEGHGSSSEKTVSKRMERVVGPIIRGLNIKTQSQLRMLFWLPGGLLTAGAVGISLWGNRQWAKAAGEANQNYDASLETLMRVDQRESPLKERARFH